MARWLPLINAIAWCARFNKMNNLITTVCFRDGQKATPKENWYCIIYGQALRLPEYVYTNKVNRGLEVRAVGIDKGRVSTLFVHPWFWDTTRAYKITSPTTVCFRRAIYIRVCRTVLATVLHDKMKRREECRIWGSDTIPLRIDYARITKQ